MKCHHVVLYFYQKDCKKCIICRVRKNWRISDIVQQTTMFIYLSKKVCIILLYQMVRVVKWFYPTKHSHNFRLNLNMSFSFHCVNETRSTISDQCKNNLCNKNYLSSGNYTILAIRILTFDWRNWRNVLMKLHFKLGLTKHLIFNAYAI